MADARRVARELALKALYQMDVGGEPLDAALDAWLEPVRRTVDRLVEEPAEEAEASIHRRLAERPKSFSPQAKRQSTSTGQTAISELRALTADLVALTRRVIAAKPSLTSDAARAAATERETAAMRRLEALRNRPTLESDFSAVLAREALERVPIMAEAFRHYIGAATFTSDFAATLARGAAERRNEIDRKLAPLSSGWGLERQAAVDRNIMRLAAWELLYSPNTPAGATINEAIELAKKYSTAESSRFVNGVLGALAAQVGPKTAIAVEAAEVEIAAPEIPEEEEE